MSKDATTSRKLLFWVVLAVVVLNVVLFLKFGLDRKPDQSTGATPASRPVPAAATNAAQKSIATPP